MPVVKTFSVTEQAYLAAANLESVGIEAVIVDNTSFDNSLLGATTGTNDISLEVAEADLERAGEILREQAALADAETAERELECSSPIDGNSMTKLKERFRTLIVIDVVLLAFREVFSEHLYYLPPEDVGDYLMSKIPSESLLLVADMAFGALLLMSLLAAVLAFRFHFLSRILYVGVIIWVMIDSFAAPPLLATSLGEAVNAIHWMATGGILAMMYLTPLSGEFRRRVAQGP